MLLGIPASGRCFRLSGMAFYRLTEGKITEASEEFDKLNLMQQLGVLPASPAPAPATG
jgi:predicted ester cyclase